MPEERIKANAVDVLLGAFENSPYVANVEVVPPTEYDLYTLAREDTYVYKSIRAMEDMRLTHEEKLIVLIQILSRRNQDLLHQLTEAHMSMPPTTIHLGGNR